MTETETQESQTMEKKVEKATPRKITVKAG